MRNNLAELITVDTSLTMPVYKQIVQSIYRNIDNGVLVQNDLLPSVNSISEKFSLARGSVFTAYNDLRAAGIIDSIPGKGYFVTSTQTKQTKKIFLLFSTFTPYKEQLYNAIINNLPKHCSVDIYFHHHSIKIFETLIREQAAYYNTFIIMPELHSDASSILSKLDQKQTFLLDVGFREFQKDYPGVYQNFDKDIYSVLMKLTSGMSKYKRLFLVFPQGLRTKDIISGFNRFSKTKTITTGIKVKIDPEEIDKGDAFIVIEDNDLVDVIKVSRKNKWKIGIDIGVISYNETNLKSVIGSGITTITTDFAAMGKTIAEMVCSDKREAIENSFIMIDRQSF